MNRFFILINLEGCCDIIGLFTYVHFIYFAAQRILISKCAKDVLFISYKRYPQMSKVFFLKFK